MSKIIDFSKYKPVNKDNETFTPEVPVFSFPKALDSLRDDQRWCSWKWKLTENGRWTKPPMRAISDEHAASNNRATWDDLEAVMFRAKRDNTRGVGLMLKGLADVAVIDLDNCVNERGEIADRAQDIIDRAGSYAEVSPSRNGVKIFGYVVGGGSSSSKVKHDGITVELFLNTARYVCVTGEQISDSSHMRDITDLFKSLADIDNPKPKNEYDPEYVEVLTEEEAAYYREALKYVDNVDRDNWIDAGHALKRFGKPGKELWDEWSARGYELFSLDEQNKNWAGFKPHSITIATMVYRAKQNGFEDARNKKTEIKLTQANQFTMADVPPRDWIVFKLLLRGSVGMIVGAGGVSKSLLSLHIATAVAAGESWAGFEVRKACRVLILNAEDDITEQRRRLTAMRFNGNTLVDKSGSNLLIPEQVDSLAIVKTDRATGTQIATPLVKTLVEVIKENQIDVLIVDPFTETLAGDENSADAVRDAMRIWREKIARECNVAVLLIHHTPKNSENMAGNANAARGSSAINNAVRTNWTVMSMTQEEATRAGIEEADRHKYVRVDDAKQNYGLLSGRAQWLEKVSVCLDNARGDIPSDWVGVLEPWVSPDLMEQFDRSAITGLLNTIEAAGGPVGELRPDTRPITFNHNSPMYIIAIIERMLGCDRATAKVVLGTWLKSGLVFKEDGVRDPETRKEVSAARVNRSLRTDLSTGLTDVLN